MGWPTRSQGKASCRPAASPRPREVAPDGNFWGPKQLPPLSFEDSFQAPASPAMLEEYGTMILLFDQAGACHSFCPYTTRGLCEQLFSYRVLGVVLQHLIHPACLDRVEASTPNSCFKAKGKSQPCLGVTLFPTKMGSPQHWSRFGPIISQQITVPKLRRRCNEDSCCATSQNTASMARS